MTLSGDTIAIFSFISGLATGAAGMFLTKIWFWSDKLCGDCRRKLGFW